MNKKWINTALKCKPYSSFGGVSSDHRIHSAKIPLSQYRNKKQTGWASRYDWPSLTRVITSSSSSCRPASTDIPDPLSPLLPIVYRLWQVFRATSRILTELPYVCSSWSSCFARPYVGVHRSTSLMSSSLLLQQCPACLVRLAWIVFVMGDRWPYSWCLVGCCRQDLFNIARNILV